MAIAKPTSAPEGEPEATHNGTTEVVPLTSNSAPSDDDPSMAIPSRATSHGTFFITSRTRNIHRVFKA
ncbi:hypothetical protein [Bryocella elongata]|uniref:hypothetical protein n=1 Tax=Bryocella elongata TaxID=863522 RepID=UPI000CDEB64F|nr:hypothetical protein [Bryocella elongata]